MPDDVPKLVDQRLRDYRRDTVEKIDDVRRDTNEKITDLRTEDIRVRGEVFHNRDRIKDLEHENVIERTRKEIYGNVGKWVGGIASGVLILIFAAMCFAGYELISWVLSEMGGTTTQLP